MALAGSPRTSRAAKTAPKRESDRRARLALVNAKALAERTQRRRARAMGLLAAVVVVFGLLVVVTGQAQVASQQVRLDNLTTELQSASALNENLQVQKAELSAPAAVLQIAEHRIHMVAPASVTYLNPLDPGPSVAQLAAATR
jgi:cell division protein FtsL